MKVDVSLEAWLALSLTRGLGGEGARQLLKEFGSPEAVIAASTSSLKSVVKPEVAAEIGKGYANEAIAPTLAWLEDSNNHIVTLADSDYPQALLNIPDPPLLLYVKGRLDLLNHSALAMVGSRNATPQGIVNAEAFAKSFSAAGLCIISGMAHGIDAAAHRGALRGQGSSIAVIGTGLDKVYPAANRDLAHALAQQGALISEFPLGTPPLPANFPRRNRIISGMSLGCLVVEASLQSGSLITARLALEQGRDVFAVPGSIHAPQSKGCHALLKQGAKLVESAQDILEELGGLLITPSLNSVTQGIDIQGTDYALLEHLGFDPVDVETLRVRSGLTIAELSAMLLTLELSGHVSTIPGGLYQRIH
ncbi:MAG: DNA protecting protein DprA [Gallionellales bacterium RIFCSPLOWO2_02_FULL_57_47]|nr:MAG: DNA protecting protein DprA [Gallionellales bacterium RIFCSPLOWO2_02_FULL_57_47]OGT16672.1 MAG: DNA protecting protein DprA [Gallionellales bacterium RIFCSPHIGHO2_02_FULL_57_16]